MLVFNNTGIELNRVCRSFTIFECNFCVRFSVDFRNNVFVLILKTVGRSTNIKISLHKFYVDGAVLDWAFNQILKMGLCLQFFVLFTLKFIK
jgi:hypothetical protein